MSPNELQAVFSRNIKTERKKLGMSQMELAEKADLSVGFISEIERGRRWGTSDTFARIADALETEPSTLLSPSREDLRREKRKAALQIAAELRENLSRADEIAIKKTFARFNAKRPRGGRPARKR